MTLRYRGSIHALAAVLLGIGLGVAVIMWGDRPQPAELAVPPPPNALTPPVVRSWREAARRVEESRGEPVGRAAAVLVPPELRHYSDHRRFLAVQVAESRAQDFELPHDYAELVQLIERGQMVEMKPVGDDYILYGVGASVSDDPLTHYDEATGTDIPLYENYADFQDAEAAMAESIGELKDKAAGVQQQLRALRAPRLRKERAAYLRRRKALQAQVKGTQAAAALLDKRRRRVASFYEDYDKRRMLVAEYRVLAGKAADFDGRSYDLRAAAGRAQFKARLLSFIRPEARDVLLEIARVYHAKFGRPLPVTSLVRTERYQQMLGEVNPNATRIATPPHTTGLAFDIYDRYMTGEEQNDLMRYVARLEDEGRVEALRENRDHIHVFAFAEGRRPDEKLIASSLEAVGPAGRPAAARPAATPRHRRVAVGAKALRAGRQTAARASSRTRPVPGVRAR
ncbi:MAG: hypothetical protein DMF80_14600 [Acidobacteria bacterium]|nr:MAG: hypothetical protein DMF80_14600 [Acidobacteriota bacterium]